MDQTVNEGLFEDRRSGKKLRRCYDTQHAEERRMRAVEIRFGAPAGAGVEDALKAQFGADALINHRLEEERNQVLKALVRAGQLSGNERATLEHYLALVRGGQLPSIESVEKDFGYKNPYVVESTGGEKVRAH